MRYKSGHTLPKAVASDDIFPWWLSPCEKSKIPIDSFPIYYCWSKNAAIWLDKWPKLPHPIKSCRIRFNFSFITSFMQKTKISLDSIQRYWWSKNTEIWFDKRHNLSYPSKSGSLRWFLPLMTNTWQKLRYNLILSRYPWQKKSAISLQKRHNQLHPNISGSLRY